MSSNGFDVLSSDLRGVLTELGYSEPTRIQVEVIKALKRDPEKHLLVTAPTGYGKTEAVVFPILDYILNCGRDCSRGIQVLYITPLRALNRDIFKRMVSLIKEKLGVDIGIRHGDTKTYERAKQSKNPPIFLITTPETLQSLLVGSSIRKALKNVKWVVIDEVHAILDSKRGVQLLVGLERLKTLADRFTIIGVSATVGNKEEILENITAGEGGRIISISDKKSYEVEVDVVPPKISYSVNTGGIVYKVDTLEIAKRIVNYVKKTKGKVLVFTNTRDMAEILGVMIRKISNLDVKVHHSSLSRDIRLKVENDFKEGNLKCVIATSSLELGIDIGEVDLVIQVMSPRRVETALQRIGRAGHTFSRESKGVIITGTFDDAFEAVAIARLIKKGVIEPVSVLSKNFDVLAHQIVGIVRERYLEGEKGADLDYVYNIVKGAWPFRDLDISEFQRLINFMENKAKLIRVEGRKIRLTRRSIRYYFENLSTIPSSIKFRVVDISEGFNKIGELDTRYVLELNQGDIFVLGGLPREVVEIDQRKKEVLVVSSHLEGKPPVWTGELLPVSKEVAEEVGRVREDIVKGSIEELKCLTDEAKKFFNNAQKVFDPNKTLPTHKNILVELDTEEGILVIHSPYGNKINATLSTLIAWFFAENQNLPYVSFDSDAYRISIRFEGKYLYSSNQIFEELESAINSLIDTSLFPGRLEEVLRDAVLEFRLNELAWYFVNVLKKFGMIRDESDLTKKQILRLVSKYRKEVVVEEAIRELVQTKMDIKGLKNLLKQIDEGKVEIWFTEGLSQISLLSNSSTNVVVKDFDFMVEKKYEERLLNRNVKYICLVCGFSKIDRVYNFVGKCEKCGSDRLTAVRPWEELEQIVKKRLSGEKLSKEETVKLRQLQAISRFMKAYGYVAILPIAATGIGLKQAIEILRRNAASKKILLQEIRKREINYYRSRSIIEKLIKNKAKGV